MNLNLPGAITKVLGGVATGVVKAHEAALEEAPGGHAVPAVVVGITYHEAAQNEEEVHGQVAVIHDLSADEGDVGLEAMEYDDHQCSHSSESVQDLIARLGSEIYVVLCHICGEFRRQR